jgi:hypothetical protein
VKVPWLARVDALVALAACAALLVAHRGEMRWGWFVALFAAIDLVGYRPGAVLARARGEVPPACFHLYNIAHGVPFSLALALGYTALHGRPDWTLLALPLHLCADRGLLGNGFKPLDGPFEPEAATA